MAMAGATPKHLYKLGLIDNLVEDEEMDVNFLMSQSLITISTLPFHLGANYVILCFSTQPLACGTTNYNSNLS